MKDVFILISNRSVAEKALKIIEEDDIKRVKIVFYNTIHEIIDFAKNKFPDSTEVILTVPGTAVLLTEILQNKIPVISVEYNNIDIVMLLCSALSYCPDSVALGHYREKNPRIADIAEIVKQPFRNFIFGNEDANNIKILRKLKEQGITAVVGGGYVCNLAKQVGLTVFPLEVNALTLRKKIYEACSIADSRKFMHRSAYYIDTILKNQTIAVVSVNSKNEIMFFNKSAEKLFGVESQTVFGKNFSLVLPENSFETVLMSKKLVENCIYTINHVDIIGDYSPIFDDGVIIGVVGIFYLMADIQKKEKIVRTYYASHNINSSYSFKDFQIENSCMQAILTQAECYANVDETVLLTGESGTGKEVMANSIHNAGKRNNKPFIAINCASIPSSLIDSELFGYVAGTFTGSKKNGAIGLFEAADGGTLFLDEISEMPFEFQAKLLRVIQEKKIRRIGSFNEIPVDVRIIASTNRDLEHEVAVKQFRMDLFYRLNVLHIHMPSLREYADKAGDIAEKILLRFMPQSTYMERKHLHALIKKMKFYNWPGNIRELENIVKRYIVLSSHYKRPVQLEDIFTPAAFTENKSESIISEKELEKQHIRKIFNKFNGNRALTAKELGISRATLWRKLKTLDEEQN